MPYAVTHILVPLIIVAIWRDYYLRNKDRRHFPLHYVLIAGIAGTIPDWDIGIFWILNLIGFSPDFFIVHKTYFHSLFIPIFFIILGGIFSSAKLPQLGKHKLFPRTIFFMLAFGSFTHILLDAFLGEPFSPFYPFHEFVFGLDFTGYLPIGVQDLFYPTLDAVLLIFYLIYLEVKHKISDFI